MKCHLIATVTAHGRLHRSHYLRSPTTYTTPILFYYTWLVQSKKLQFGRLQPKFMLEQIRVAWIPHEQLSTTSITNMTLREGLFHWTDSIEPQQGKLSREDRLSELVSYWVSWSASTSFTNRFAAACWNACLPLAANSSPRSSLVLSWRLYLTSGIFTLSIWHNLSEMKSIISTHGRLWYYHAYVSFFLCRAVEIPPTGQRCSAD